MRTYVLTILLLLSIASKAQLAVINDPDGYVNVHKESNFKSEIINKLTDDDVVLYDDDHQPDDSKWTNIYYSPENTTIFSSTSTYTLKMNYITGFVHTSRITPIDNLTKFILKKGIGYINNKDTILILIKTSPFNLASHRIHKSAEGLGNRKFFSVDKIDNKKPWGVDGNIPTQGIFKITLSLNGKEIIMPPSSYNDLFQANPENLSVHYKQGNFYLYMPSNSDGAGGYDVVWVISNGKLIKRYVDSI